MYYNSRYNFVFETTDGIILYNSKTGSSTLLNGKDGKTLSELLTGPKTLIEEDSLPKQVLNTFVRNGFIVEESRNELTEVSETYWKARGETPMVLTLTTTMDCNLGCYYCYEDRSGNQLESNDSEEIINMIEKVLSNSPKKSLHVDWYGGEPLLNISFLEEMSYKLQAYCKDKNLKYNASIISNGTVWPDNVKQFIRDHQIRQVQISFDGNKENHNKRRRYRKEHLQNGGNSFDVTMNLVDKLLDCVHTDIRFNIDWRNKSDIIPFIDLIIERGWFNKKYPAVFQPARLSSYSEKSSFMGQKELSLEEFDELRRAVGVRLEGVGKVEESEVPDQYPFPRKHVCAALASDSFVVGAEKLIYRCGLQVGEKNRAVGSLNETTSNFNDSQWWDNFDPTKKEPCSSCSFLPVCFGGCPKNHLENNQKYLDEQSDYWRTNLGIKIAKYLNKELIDHSALDEKYQFRSNY